MLSKQVQQNNPLMNVLSALKNGGTPKEIVLNMLAKGAVNKNPAMQQLIELAQKGDNATLEEMARKLFAQNGRSYDEEFAKFQSYFK